MCWSSLLEKCRPLQLAQPVSDLPAPWTPPHPGYWPLEPTYARLPLLSSLISQPLSRAGWDVGRLGDSTSCSFGHRSGSIHTGGCPQASLIIGADGSKGPIPSGLCGSLLSWWQQKHAAGGRQSSEHLLWEPRVAGSQGTAGRVRPKTCAALPGGCLFVLIKGGRADSPCSGSFLPAQRAQPALAPPRAL